MDNCRFRCEEYGGDYGAGKSYYRTGSDNSVSG